MNPWDDRDDLGLVRAFFSSGRQLLTSPREFYAATDLQRRLGGPLSFAVVSLTLGFLLEAISMSLLAPLLARWVPDGAASPVALLDVQFAFLPEWLLPFLGCQVAVLAVPLTVVFFALALAIWSLFTHSVLLVTGSLRSSSAGLRGTFVAVCYSTVGAFAQVVPALGDLVFGIAMVVIQVAGLRQIHGTTIPRALSAALAPMILVLTLVVLAALGRLAAG